MKTWRVHDSFFDDLVAIDGRDLVHVRLLTFLRLDDLATRSYGLPGRTLRGSFHGSEVVDLVSGQWQPAGILSAFMVIWYVESGKQVSALFAEHANTLRGRTALDIALDRADSTGYARATFK